MCYSAQVHESYLKFVRRTGARIDFREFLRLYVRRGEDRRLRIPRAIDRWFDGSTSDDAVQIKTLIDAFDADEATRLEQELFAQKTRLNNATRALATKITKKAKEDVRIATIKIDTAQVRLDDLRRDTGNARDRRFFPSWYVPVLIAGDDGLRVVPMRYQCRPAGKPVFYDTKFPGTYNARRDNLEGFWKAQFGHTHGMVMADVFYENVQGPDGENRGLRFAPRDGTPLYIACLWSHWTDPAGKLPDLYSFAAVTDDPEPEVAAAGHDRTIVNLREENVDAWLRPNGDLDRMYALMDDKQHPYYEHRIAA